MDLSSWLLSTTDDYNTDPPGPGEYVDILRGLEEYNPRDERFKNHIGNITRLAMSQKDMISRYALEKFVEQYKNERRRIRTIDEGDDYGRSALHWMIGANYQPGYSQLIRLGADINNLTWQEGFTPLMVACRKGGSAKTAKYLLDLNADVHIRAKNSATAFHIATVSSSRDCMRLLVMCGADPFALLEDGRSALDLARDDTTKSLVYSCYRSATIRDEKEGAKCANCNIADVKLDRCGKCYITFYCSRRCQLDHWKEGHRADCKGSVTASITRQAKTSTRGKGDAAKKKAEKAFIVELSFSEEDKKYIIINKERSIHAVIQHESPEKLEELVQYFQSFNVETLLFWAKYVDVSKKELNVYHNKPLRIQKSTTAEKPEDSEKCDKVEDEESTSK